MRLLNTQTLELKQFNTGSIPVYAILSHTWEDDEVTLQELQTRAARRKKGFRKISDFCDEAASRGIEWGWVDTCCIDKTDLVELSQAINSMFSWYRDAAVCLAYLSDFHLHGEGAHWNDKDVGKSRWFTRGWTLQELIAPKHLVFYDARWRVFGTKKGLASFMSDITGISARLLRGEKSLHEFSCAQKMSWAAYRQTTRVEDRAYSLLGLFNICFSPVYGEGWRAFGRLQEEILRVSTDQSIFAWTQNGPLNPSSASNKGKPKERSLGHRCSILAPTPDCFHDSSSIVCAPNDAVNRSHPRMARHLSDVPRESRAMLNRPIALTNTGLQIALLVNTIKVSHQRCLVEAMLNCRHNHDRSSKITIFLMAETAGSRCDNKNGIVPAWRVEPYFLGTTTRMRDNVVTFDIYPIHATWPESLDGRRSVVLDRREYEEQRKAAKRRICGEKKEATKKANRHNLSLAAGAAVVMGGLLYKRFTSNDPVLNDKANQPAPPCSYTIFSSSLPNASWGRDDFSFSHDLETPPR